MSDGQAAPPLRESPAVRTFPIFARNRKQNPMILNDADLNEAATAIRRGMEVFVHREHGRMLVVDDPERNVRADPEVYESTMQYINQDRDAYIHIERLEANAALDIMRAFTDRVRSQELWTALTYALKRPRPFVTFKSELSKFPKNYEKWREFRQREYRKYVEKSLQDS